MVCFNTYISVMLIRYPEQVIDLLPYSSTITKASADYEDTPWLAYDSHFHKLAEAEADKQKSSGGKWQVMSVRQESQRLQPYWKKGPQMCQQWNRAQGGCNDPACTYYHIYLECHVRDHKITRCPLNKPNPVKVKPQQFFQGFIGNLQ